MTDYYNYLDNSKLNEIMCALIIFINLSMSLSFNRRGMTMRKLLFIIPFVFSLLAIPSYAGTPLDSTVVNEALKKSLDYQGKWKQIIFSDGSIQTSVAAASGVSQAQSDTMLALSSPSSTLYFINADTKVGTHGQHAGTVSSGRFVQITSMNSRAIDGNVPFLQIDDNPTYGLGGLSVNHTLSHENIWIAGIGGGTVTFNIQNQSGGVGTNSYSYIEYGTASAGSSRLVFNTAKTVYGTHSVQVGTVSSGHVWHITQLVAGAASGVTPPEAYPAYFNIDRIIDVAPIKYSVYTGHTVTNIWVSGLNGTRTIFIKAFEGSIRAPGMSYIDYLIQPL